MSDITEPTAGDESVWKRLLFMLLYAFLYGVSDIVLFTVALIQFGFVALRLSEYMAVWVKADILKNFHLKMHVAAPF